MANEKRLIDANALKQRFDEREAEDIELYGCHIIECFQADDAKEIVDQMPTVEAVEVVHGWWEPRADVCGFVRCSVCHDCNIYNDWPDGKKWNYCPHCGAKMDGGNEDV